MTLLLGQDKNHEHRRDDSISGDPCVENLELRVPRQREPLPCFLEPISYTTKLARRGTCKFKLIRRISFPFAPQTSLPSCSANFYGMTTRRRLAGRGSNGTSRRETVSGAAPQHRAYSEVYQDIASDLKSISNLECLRDP